MKTSELIGPALDWAVAKCEGGTDFCFDGITWGFKLSGNQKVLAKGWAPSLSFSPSTDWAQGRSMIEREEIGIKRNAPSSRGREWEASPSITAKGAGGRWGYGPTSLVAAMRCFVASKLGDEIEIPEELK